MDNSTLNKDSVAKLLETAFGRLKKDHPQVSLRALAQRMELSSSYLSKVMRGLKPVTPSLIPKLKKAYHLDVLEMQTLQRLVLEDIEKNNLTPATGLKSLETKPSKATDYESLSKKDFLLLEKWFYIPLLNLLTLPNFESNSLWIAQQLGMSEKEVLEALKALERGGYIERKDQILRLTKMKARFPTDRSHEMVRKYHELMMKKALQELQREATQEAFDQRLINGISFAGDHKKIKRAKAILDQALYEVAELMSEENADAVYQLNVQFFKITK